MSTVKKPASNNNSRSKPKKNAKTSLSTGSISKYFIGGCGRQPGLIKTDNLDSKRVENNVKVDSEIELKLRAATSPPSDISSTTSDAAAASSSSSSSFNIAKQPKKKAEPPTETELKILNEFDVETTFGPCMGMTRSERVARARRYLIDRLSVTEEKKLHHVETILDQHRGDPAFERCVLDGPLRFVRD